jgi:hypothetical protein
MSERERPAPLVVSGNLAGDNGSGQALVPQSISRSQYLARVRRERLVAVVHGLGPRAVFELLDELDRHHGLSPDIDGRLERYAGLDPAALRAAGGDRFPMAPTRAIGARA